MDNGYNWVYKQLVQHENDLVGAIAYSLYKQHKIEWIKKCEQDNGTSPTKEQLTEFHRFSSSYTSLENYRNNAEQLMSGFLSYVTENIADDMQKQNKQVIHDELVELLKPIQNEIAKKKDWKQLVIDALVSVFGTIIVIILIGFLLRGYQWISSVTPLP